MVVLLCGFLLYFIYYFIISHVIFITFLFGDIIIVSRTYYLKTTGVVLACFEKKNVYISEGWPKQTHRRVSVKNTSGKKISFALTNSRYNEQFSGSLQSSLYRDSTAFSKTEPTKNSRDHTPKVQNC